MKHSIKQSFQRLSIILIILSSFFFPLSKNGVFIPIYEVIESIIVLLCVFVELILNKTSSTKLFVSFSIIVYLFIGTIITLSQYKSGFVFGYVRCVYLVSSLLMFSIVCINSIPFSFFKKTLDVVMVIVIVFSILSLINAFNLNDFFVNKYTQYREYITVYQFQLKKPLLTFGVHNIASFIYEGLFLLSWFSYKKLNEKRYMIYSIACIVLLLGLRCTTSIGYLIFSVAIIVYSQSRSTKKLIISVFLLIICSIAALQFGLIDTYSDILGKEANGIIPRYFSGMESLYGNNLQMIKNTILGTGYCISDGTNGIYGADSGFIISLMIGNVIYFIVFYCYIKKFLSDNINSKQATIIYVYVLLMELGFISFLYFRTIAFLLYIVLYLSSLNTLDERQDEKMGEIYAR
ncbi:MAG: hypothetical protein IK999_08985 [Ruminococcus sp.]|nr:hypothetical protein [Ruminococcus sp.]